MRQEKYLTWQSDPGKYTEAYRNTQKHTEIHRNTQKHTKIHRETHRNTQKNIKQCSIVSQKQNASGACAAREASDMTLALEKTHIHTETHRYTQKIQKHTKIHKNICPIVSQKRNASGACAAREASDTQKYIELHALSEVKGQLFGRHTLYFIHTTSTPNIVKFVKDFLS